MEATISLDGWDIHRFDETEWGPWSGSAGDAKAKILGSGDGYHVALVDAAPGYRGSPHVHEHAEFFTMLEGTVRNQGTVMTKGDCYVAAAGSSHTDFATDTGARYVVVFKL
jgi:mannose-6-phosphate isomerase-like protein (cupin superfamily)